MAQQKKNMFKNNLHAALLSKLEKSTNKCQEEEHLDSFAEELEKVRLRVKKMEEKQ